MRILMIEDDPNIVDFVKVVFSVGLPQAELRSTHLGGSGLDLLDSYSPDIVLLDLGLPDMSGFDVLKHIRKSSRIPVLILTVRNDEHSVVKALEMGAEDFVLKPCRQLELLARVQAILRRQNFNPKQEPLVIGELTFNPQTQEVSLKNKLIALTRTESTILYQLMLNQGKVVSISDLSRAIWGSEYGATDSIKVYIYQLRHKLEPNPSHPRIILSKPRLGYYLSPSL